MIKYVVVGREIEDDTKSVVYGPLSKELCEAFVEGVEYVNDSSLVVDIREATEEEIAMRERVLEGISHVQG